MSRPGIHCVESQSLVNLHLQNHRIVIVIILRLSLNRVFQCFSSYPTALKGCQGIVFTRGVWMGGWVVGRAGGGKKFVWAISQKP